MSKKIFAVAVCICLLMTLALWTSPHPVYSFGKQILKVGSRGGDVYELQGRLSYLGFYTGKIDGQYGWRTYNAVRYFQWKFGMKVDGLVGSKTKLMLWKATKKWSPGMTAGGQSQSASPAKTTSYGSNDVNLLARTVFGEARGEPYTGQVAVAAVILNRVESSKFPKTISGVIYQPGAFTAVSDGQIWLDPDSEAFKAAHDALNGWDPSGNALYYFNPNTATSDWIWSRPQIKQIGDHIFTK